MDKPITTESPPLPSGASIYVSMFAIFAVIAAYVTINWMLMKREMRRQNQGLVASEESGPSYRRGEEGEDWVNMGAGSIQMQVESAATSVRSFFGFGGRSSRGYSRVDLDDNTTEGARLIEFDEDDIKQT